MRRRNGVVLFEVLVALAVFAISFVGIGRIIASLVDVAGRVERARYIRGQMESRLALLKKGQMQPQREEEKADGRGIVYILEIKKAEVRGEKNALLNGLYNVRVEAVWKQGKDEQADELETLYYQP